MFSYRQAHFHGINKNENWQLAHIKRVNKYPAGAKVLLYGKEIAHNDNRGVRLARLPEEPD
jgi:hypothetical protein